MTLRTQIFHLTDELGNYLTDESGNRLIANIAINDFGMKAGATPVILHGYAPAGNYGSGVLTFYLTDENGNKLTDESGNRLIAKIRINTRLLYAAATRTLVHGG